MTDLGKKTLNGIVSDTPASIKKVVKPSKPDNVVDIPDFMKRKSIRLSQEYGQRQRQLYQQVNTPAPRLRLGRALKNFFRLFFE